MQMSFCRIFVTISRPWNDGADVLAECICQLAILIAKVINDKYIPHIRWHTKLLSGTCVQMIRFEPHADTKYVNSDYETTTTTTTTYL